MPDPTTVQGAVVGMLRADAVLAALVGPGSVVGGEVPEEFPLPHVVIHDVEARREWITTAARVEEHKLTVRCFAAAATAVGQDNPADALALNVERVLNWQDLPIPGTTPVSFVQTDHVLKVDRRRAGTKERVFECELKWDVRLGVG
jgi:hypothetical protein